MFLDFYFFIIYYLFSNDRTKSCGSATQCSPTPGQGSGMTPMHSGSRMPIYGSQTSLYDGSRTPHYGSGMTPSHEPGSMTPSGCGQVRGIHGAPTLRWDGCVGVGCVGVYAGVDGYGYVNEFSVSKLYNWKVINNIKFWFTVYYYYYYKIEGKIIYPIINI